MQQYNTSSPLNLIALDYDPSPIVNIISLQLGENHDFIYLFYVSFLHPDDGDIQDTKIILVLQRLLSDGSTWRGHYLHR